MAYDRLADAIIRHSKLILAVWVVILLVAAVPAINAFKNMSYDMDEMGIEESESMVGLEVIGTYFPSSDADVSSLPMLVVGFDDETEYDAALSLETALNQAVREGVFGSVNDEGVVEQKIQGNLQQGCRIRKDDPWRKGQTAVRPAPLSDEQQRRAQAARDERQLQGAQEICPPQHPAHQAQLDIAHAEAGLPQMIHRQHEQSGNAHPDQHLRQRRQIAGKKTNDKQRQRKHIRNDHPLSIDLRDRDQDQQLRITEECRAQIIRTDSGSPCARGKQDERERTKLRLIMSEQHIQREHSAKQRDHVTTSLPSSYVRRARHTKKHAHPQTCMP